MSSKDETLIDILSVCAGPSRDALVWSPGGKERVLSLSNVRNKEVARNMSSMQLFHKVHFNVLIFWNLLCLQFWHFVSFASMISYCPVFHNFH